VVWQVATRDEISGDKALAQANRTEADQAWEDAERFQTRSSRPSSSARREGEEKRKRDGDNKTSKIDDAR
jgi:hypothetical protein